MSKMKASVFIQKLKDVALNYKTLYVMGCFGAPMNSKNKERYTHNNEYNMRASRTKMIRAATDDTFGFDCVCLIKGILWGWNGDKSKVYGGAGYGINGVPDIGADGMIKVCSGVSTTGWANMIPGEAVWCSGHIGVYIGDGLAVECTPAFKNKVQITAVRNIGAKSGYSSRKWTKHGRLPYIDYDIQVTGIPSTGGDSDEKYIHDGLMALIGNEIGVCALMGSLYHESGLISNNMENAYENKPAKTGGVGYNDVTYTAAVDSGAYTGFINDGVGYGWAQWTYHSRKKGLLDTAKKMGKSIADKEVQMTWLKGELTTSFKSSVLTPLQSATNIRAASDIVVRKFENPANQSEEMLAKRAATSQAYYAKYKGGASTPSTPTNPSSPTKPVKVDVAKKKDSKLAGSYRVNASVGLNLRTGVGKTSLQVMKNGSIVQNYGYYNVASDGTIWLYVVAPNGQVGYCSKNYLQRV